MPRKVDVVFERNPPPWKAEVEDPDTDFHTFTVRDAKGDLVCRVTLNEATNADDSVIQRLMDAVWYYTQGGPEEEP